MSVILQCASSVSALAQATGNAVSQGVVTYAPVRATFDTVRAETWIPYGGAEGARIIVPVLVDGEEAHAIIDTGATDTLLDAGWARRHDLPLHAIQAASALGGVSVQQWSTPLKALTVGGFMQTGGSLHVVDLSALQALAGSFEMVIGFDLLSHLAIDIDPDHTRIRLRMSGAPRPIGHAVPLHITPDGQHFATSLSVSGKELPSVVIDTGDDSALAIDRTTFGAYPKGLRVTDLMQQGAGGILVDDYALSDQVRWGDLSATRVPTGFESHPVNDTIVARVGLELLTRWNVFIDGPKGVMVLSDRQQAARPAHTTNTGIQYAATVGGLTAVHVMKHSPAQAAGLKDGDRICAVDGNPVAHASDLPQGPDGSLMKLTLCDGHQLSLTRAAFY